MTDPLQADGDDRRTREIGADILTRLARLEGLLDGFLIALGSHPDIKATHNAPDPTTTRSAR